MFFPVKQITQTHWIITTGCSVEETSLKPRVETKILRGRKRGVSEQISGWFVSVNMRRRNQGVARLEFERQPSRSDESELLSPESPPPPAYYLLNKHSRLLTDGGHVCKTKALHFNKKAIITIIIHKLRSRRFIYRCYADVDAALIRSENKGARHNSAERCQRASL